MKPKEYLELLEKAMAKRGDSGIIRARYYGARDMYELFTRPWREHEQTEKRKAYRKEYYQKHKAEILNYQREYRAKKKGER